MEEVLLGFMVAAWIFTLGHLYLDWKAKAATLKALDAKLTEEITTRANQTNELKAEIGLRKTQFMSNEQVAELERELRMKTLGRATDGNLWK